MGYTDKYELEEISYGTTGWNGILTSDLQILDDVIQTYIVSTAMETISGSELVEQRTDGVYKAQTTLSGTDYQPLGFATETATSGNSIRVQIIGLYESTALTLVAGTRYYTSRDTAGAITDTVVVSGSNSQDYIGIAVSTSGIVLQI